MQGLARFKENADFAPRKTEFAAIRAELRSEVFVHDEWRCPLCREITGGRRFQKLVIDGIQW